MEVRSFRKRFWYLIDFAWTEGQKSYASEEEYPASICVRNLAGPRTSLILEARRTVGVPLAPDGTRPHNLISSDQLLNSDGIRLVLVIFLDLQNG
jgi:hypothetical protein